MLTFVFLGLLLIRAQSRYVINAERIECNLTKGQHVIRAYARHEKTPHWGVLLYINPCCKFTCSLGDDIFNGGNDGFVIDHIGIGRCGNNACASLLA